MFTNFLRCHLLGGILLIVGGLSASCTVSRPSASRSAISQVLSAQTEAWNRGDVNGFMQGYWQSDSLVFIGKNGLTYGWAKTLANYQRSYPTSEAMGKLTFSGLRVSPIGSHAAHVVGRWHLQRPGLGDLGGSFLLVFRQLNGRWVIVADHSS